MLQQITRFDDGSLLAGLDEMTRFMKCQWFPGRDEAFSHKLDKEAQSPEPLAWQLGASRLDNRVDSGPIKFPICSGPASS